MAKGGIHHPIMRHPEHQFLDADAGQQVVLGLQTVVGRMVQIKNIGKMRVIIGNPRQHAVAAHAVF